MEERMAEPAEEVAQQPPVEENDESDGEEGGRMFAWVVNDNMEEDEEDEDDEEVEVEDEQPLDTEASESFELDAPAERSGHIAVVYENIMYVWGGYRVSTFTTKTLQSINPFQTDPNIFCNFFLFSCTRILECTDSLTCICQGTKSGPTTWRQECGRS